MNKQLLQGMIECISPSGKEEMMMKYVHQHYKNVFEDFLVDEQGTMTGVYNKDAGFKIQLAGHADEISLIVVGYNDNGSLCVEKNGGINTRLFVGTKVQLLLPTGVIKGVMGTTSSMNKKSELAASDLFVDIGCDTKEEAEKLVPLGTYIVHDSTLVELQNDKLSGRAFDDRIGVYVVYEAARRAIEMGTKNGIYATATTGEETTGRGAFTSASRIHPNVCVAVDVTYATDYKDCDEPGEVKLGKGGVICRGSIPNARLNDLLAQCAKELDLPVQYEVFAGRTYTDADTILQTNEGVPQVLFSIPLRYMHSPVEVLNMKDVDAMVEVLALFLVKLNENYSLLPYTLD